MATISWKKTYEVGIVAMDDEHQRLIEQINRLFEAIRDKRGEDVIHEVLAMVESYTQEHFVHEEKLMAEYGYPELKEHQAIHQKLRDDLQLIMDKATHGTEQMAAELLKFLRHWLLEHIVEVDKRYAAFLEPRFGRFIS